MQNYIPNCILSSFLLLMACSPPMSSTMIADTTSLASLQSMANVRQDTARRPVTSKIREMALKEVALSLGAQGGLACRSKTIDEELTKQTRYLDSIFDFNSLVIEHNVLPPVLQEGRNTLNLADTQTIRISDRTYRVAKQAHFITTPPNWRQYLWMDYKRPEQPAIALLPKTKDERTIWAAYVTRGWRQGVEQANAILESSLARIKEDFDGMILYRKLLAMNMVSPPYVSHTDLGVTGDASEMHIDDRVLRITALPALNVNTEEWRAAVAKDEVALEQLMQMEKSIQGVEIKINNHSWEPTITPHAIS